MYKDISCEGLKSQGLLVKPHEYQLFGINWISKSFAAAKHSGNILGDEMGLGKTLQVSFSFSVKFFFFINEGKERKR